MNQKIKILHLEDVTTDAELVARELNKFDLPFEQLVVDTRSEYIDAIRNFSPDIVLCDHSLPAFNSHEALKLLKASSKHIPFILITATLSENVAEGVMQDGADDYILKDRLKRLPHAVINALEKYRHEKDKKLILQQAKEKESRSKMLLERAYDKLSVATKAAQIGVWEHDVAEGKISGDAITLALYQLTDDFVSFEHWLSFLHPKDSERVLSEILFSFEDSTNYETEYRIVIDGEVTFIKATGVVLKDEAGQPFRMVGTNQDITAQKEADHLVKTNEAKYRAFFENSMDAILLTTPDGRILDANPAGCEIFGHTLEELTNLRRNSLIDLSDKNLKPLLSLRNQVGKATGELTFLRKDGMKFQGDVSSAVFKDSYGEERTCMIIRDITLRKNLEKAIEQERARYTDLFLSAPSGVGLLMGPGHVFEMANPTYLSMVGNTAIFGKTIKDVFPQMEAAGMLSFLDEVYETGLPYIGREQQVQFYKAESGETTTLYIDSVYQPYVDSNGIVVGILFFANDVSQKVTARRIAEQKEKNYRQLFHSVPIPQFILHPGTLAFLKINNTALKHYGFSKRDMESMTYFDLCPEKDHKTIRKLLVQNKSKRHTKFVLHNHTKKGDAIMVEVRAVCIEYQEAPALLVSISDITDQVNFQRQMSELEIAAQKRITIAQIKAQEAEREYIGAELHDDVNQRLATVKLYLDLAYSQENMRIELIKKSENIVNTTISDIRSLCRSLIPVTIQTNSLTAALEELFHQYLVAQRFKIHFESSGYLARLGPDLKLSFYRIIQEQLNNITKYAEAKNAWIQFGYEGGFLRLMIKDDGKGMDSRSGTTGLGTANMKSRIAIYNGTMDIVSNPGQGYTLYISVPFTDGGEE